MNFTFLRRWLGSSPRDSKVKPPELFPTDNPPDEIIEDEGLHDDKLPDENPPLEGSPNDKNSRYEPELDVEAPGSTTMPPPLIEPGDWKQLRPGEEFASRKEHLEAELYRVDLLIKIDLLQRHSRRLIAARGDESADQPLPAGWSAILASPFSWDEPIDAECEQEIRKLEELLRRVEQEIVHRLAKSRTNLSAFCRQFDLVRVSTQGKAIRRDTVSLDVLLLAFLVDRVPRYRMLLDLDHPAQPRSALASEQALRIVQHWEKPSRLRRSVFHDSENLIADRLIHRGSLASQSPESHYFWIDPRISSWLVGENAIDPRISDACSIYQEPANWDLLHLDDGTRSALRNLSAIWFETSKERKKHLPHPREGSRLVMQLQGPEGTPFLPVVQAFCSSQNPLVVDLAAARAKERDWEELIRRCYREAYLLQKPLVLHRGELLAHSHQPAEYRDIVLNEAERSKRMTFITSTVSWDVGNRFRSPQDICLHLSVPLPPMEIREKIWRSRLQNVNETLLPDPVAETILLDGLSSFQFTEGQIDSALANACATALIAHPHSPVPTVEDLYEGCRRQSARHLVSFSQRIQPRTDANALDRVVVPEAVAQQLRELAESMNHLDTVHHRLGFERRLSLGRGLVALFTGQSGTGKTWAATLLAGSNKKDLYKVDMAAVVSKYVGETEKNLDRVFHDAQNANAVLFFDEADALFGKRGSIEQAQDRWANLEVNFLLQRIEDYTGTVILATNFRDNIDEAFLRRIQVLIQFPIPDAASRLRILQGMFPVARAGEPEVLIPPPDRDQQDVADRFELTGGSLKNVTLDAVFRAVSEQQAALRRQQPVAIRGNHLVLGVAREYQKLNKPITRGEFGGNWFDLAMRELKFRMRT